MDFNHLLFSLDGRISRGAFWTGMAILIAASTVLNLSLGELFGVSQSEWLRNVRTPQTIRLDIAVNTILLLPSYAITLKRLHDRGRGAFPAVLLYLLYVLILSLEALGFADPRQQPSGPYFIASLAFLGTTLWLLVELGVRRGVEGDNPFGRDPLAPDELPQRKSAQG